MKGLARGGWAALAMAAALALLASPAQAAKKPDLAVTGVKGVSATALTGDKLPLKVKVANQGKGKSKPSKVTARLGAETGSPLLNVVGNGKVGPLAPRRSKTVKIKATIPGTAVGAWAVTACVPPRKQANDCGTSSRVEVGDGSSWALIQAARASGALTPGEADLDGLYALTGDSRLPKPYRGKGATSDAGVFGQIVEDWPSLTTAEQDALWPYLLQPRYAQSAWAPSGAKKAGPDASGSRGAPGPNPCADIDEVQGAWNGIPTAHAVFWYRPGSSAGKANAQRLSREFEQKVWPKLTGAFKAIDDTAAAPCDPAGDPKIDVYLGAAGLFREGAEGVAPPVPIGPPNSCGPYPAFVTLDEGANRWTLAHEFMHAIQWAYPACDRQTTWVEGTATWAADFVYSGDQDEQRYYANGIFLPYRSLLGNDAGDYSSGYHSWPFWYSIAKHNGGAAAIKGFLESLAGRNFSGALAALPGGGLRAAWKHFAVERWNQAPIGSAGFEVRESFKKWDSFNTTPVVGSEATDVKLEGALPERTFAVETYGPGGFATPSTDLGPLSTSFSRVKVDDRNVRELRFTNAVAGNREALVQAFLKLKDGNWRLEDWSEKGTVTLCRDKADEDVRELIVATSNASAMGGPLGRVKHELRARNHCEQAPIVGSFNGSEGFTSTDGQVTMTFNFNGNVELEPNGQTNPTSDWGPQWPDETWNRYTVRSGSYSLTGHGTSYGCTVDLIPATYQLRPESSGRPNQIAIQPGPEPLYGLDVKPDDQQLPQANVSCPPDDTTYTGTFAPSSHVIYTQDPVQTMQRGTYQGTSNPSYEEYQGNFGWSLSGG